MDVEVMMAQGVIIFLPGGEDPPDGLKIGAHYQGLCLSKGPLEVVVAQPGVLELYEAWQFLLNLACDNVHLLITKAEHDSLRALSPLVRLTSTVRVPEGPLDACMLRRGIQ
jgi:hypothetical protein